ncbi:phosphotransferase [Microvirga subterranea]|uniref:Hydroxylysine kinase n=1 Tax=Microvirga subterranea TaxID=186651 RepID=A0A370HJR2_9HYPH|nr:phosphotransferase [Microvirga subterranea]RDI57926.1 homoserine kinase [Microvirga subterranea]
MTLQQDINVSLATAVPDLSAQEAEQIAADLYGLDAVASELKGERDRNFHLRTQDERHYVLKVSNPAEDVQVTHFQTQALLHVEDRDGTLPVPRVIRTREGRAEALLARSGAEPRIVRILTYLQGEPLHRAPHSSAQRRNLGACLARLDLALQGFTHPGSGHELMWDLQHASRARGLLVHIADEARRALATRFLDAFESHALPLMPGLRAQIIHNDLNPHNVLVFPDAPDEISGIIDFGDAVHAPLVCDLAVAAAYQMTEVGHPLEGPGHMVSGFHAVLPLEPEEIDILFDLIATRMVLTVAISNWRASRYPENRDYILRNAPRAWAGLESLAQLSRDEAQTYLRQACQGA